MKKLSKVALMCICLLITALFTSACGGGGKATPPSYPYFPINNNQANNEQVNNNENQNANNNENNNEEAPTAVIALSLIDSLNADKIATADIYYSVVDNTKRLRGEAEESNEEDITPVDSSANTANTANEDQVILKAEPTPNDNTKFALPDNVDLTNTKIKAILTYDSEGNLLDYFSSYNGVSPENNTFNIDFGNSKDNELGFGGGTGTADDPFIISAPRHFVNIDQIDEEAGIPFYAVQYYGEIEGDIEGGFEATPIISIDDIPIEDNTQQKGFYFKQTEDLDFSHLTGLKINKTESKKAITDLAIDVINEKAPFFNNEHGIKPIGSYIRKIEYDGDTHEQAIPFIGNYDGDNHIIDGIIIANPVFDYENNEGGYGCIGLFSNTEDSTIQNLTIGENSIFFMNKLNQNIFLHSIGAIAGNLNNSTVKKCENRADILLSNIETNYYYCLLSINGIAVQESSGSSINNCKNKGNITIANCNITSDTAGISIGNAIISYNPSNTKNTNNINEGDINIINNKFSSSGFNLLTIETVENEYTNKGNITIDNNTNIKEMSIANNIITAESVEMKNCTNERDIIITNNTVEDENNKGSINVHNFVGNSFSNCVNNGNIIIDSNTNYNVQEAKNIDGRDGATNNGKVIFNGVEGDVLTL